VPILATKPPWSDATTPGTTGTTGTTG
jgi:hypothetical protein